jgi:hypothetical protein
MDRVSTATSGANASSADYNTFQDRALGIAQAGGLWISRPTLRSTGAAQVTVGPTAGLILGSGGTTHNDRALPAKTETAVSIAGAAAPSTWVRVFAYASSGAIAYEASATGLDTSGLWKSGAVGTHRYVGCVYVAADGTMHKFKMHNGVYTYQRSANLAAWEGLIALGPGATAWSTLALAAVFPPHVTTGRGKLYGTNSSTTLDASVELRTMGDTTHYEQMVLQSGESGRANNGALPVDLITDANRDMQYQVTNGFASLSLDVLGFTEP